MIFKLHSLQQLVSKMPFLRYNDCKFFLLVEDYYKLTTSISKFKPWKMQEPTTCHRCTCQLDVQPQDFEKDIKSFIDFTNLFFQQTTTQSFSNIHHFLLRGVSQEDLQMSEVSDWLVIHDILVQTGLEVELTNIRRLVRIPCGPLNLNIIKIENDINIYLEVTGDIENTELVENLKTTLGLGQEIHQNWTELKSENTKDIKKDPYV